jgi:hypothetical protein
LKKTDITFIVLQLLVRVKNFALCVILITLIFSAKAQNPTIVEGVIIDSLFEAIPFANIIVPNTTIGTTSNIEGYYKLELKKTTSDSLTVSCIGYKSEKIKIQLGISQKINIQLTPQDFEIGEVVIGPRENPAVPIIKAVVANKEKNDPEKKDFNYSNNAYTKIEFDVKNVQAPKQKGIINKNFGFVFENIDTLAETDVPYLPVMIVETNSTKYHIPGNTPVENEIIHATQIAGLQDASLAKFSGSMYLDANIYNNQLNFDNVNIASPLSSAPLMFYKYYLTDSLTDHKGRKIFELTFMPKLKKSSAFYGKMYVVDSIFAVTKIDMRLSENVNINFLNKWHINCTFSEVLPGQWFLEDYKGFFDIQFEEGNKLKLPGFYGLVNIVNSNYKFDIDVETSLKEIKEKKYVAARDVLKDTSYWRNNRPVELSVREKKIYQMADSITKVPLFIKTQHTFEMLFNGYYKMGKVEFGQYQRIYSFNEIEGHRFRAGMRTTNQFSKKIRLGGFMAYGTKDNRIKYGADIDYVFNPIPRLSAHLNYSHDMRVLGQTDNPFLKSTILSTLLERNPNNKLTMIDEYKASIQKEWFVGLMNTFSFAYYTMEPTEFIPFILTNGDTLSRINTAALGLSTTISPGTEVIAGAFGRESFGTHKPIITVDMNWGIKGIFQSQYDYFRLGLHYFHDFPLYSLGFFRYGFQAGKIWGTVPYPLLKLHEGNETYVFVQDAFNMMNYYEFASDLYVGFNFEHHFNGFFFNKIPLVRRLNMREVITGRGIWGSISTENLNYMKFPVGLNSLKNDPYFEAGFGVENIFKLVRLDALWRLTHLDNPNIQKFSIRVSLNLAF